MKVVPTGAKAPSISTTMTTTTNTAARDKAIAMLTHPNQQGQTNHAVDQNNVSPEQMSAVKQPTQPAQTEQSHTDVPSEVIDEAQAAPKEPTQPDPQSTQYAILARKEKALRAQAQQQQAAIKAERAAMAAEKTEIERMKQEYQTNYVSKQQLKSQTLQTLKDAGVTYDEVTQQQIDESNISPSMQAHINRLEARLAKQEQEIANSRTAAAEQQDQAYKAAVKQIHADAAKLVKTDPAFETVRATNSIRDVVELIELTYKEDGVILSVEEAAQQVEDHLLSEVDKLLKIDKIKKRTTTAPAMQQATQTQQPTQSKQPQPMRTLTNATTSQRQLTSKERAVLAFKGELKS